MEIGGMDCIVTSRGGLLTATDSASQRLLSLKYMVISISQKSGRFEFLRSMPFEMRLGAAIRQALVAKYDFLRQQRRRQVDRCDFLFIKKP
jgi:hypothetical protein